MPPKKVAHLVHVSTGPVGMTSEPSHTIAIDSTRLERDFVEYIGLAERMLARAQTRGIEIDSVTLSLGVSAEGGVLFFAKAGVEASIEVVVKRVDKSKSKSG